MTAAQDLDAAVAAGIITQEQADKLRTAETAHPAPEPKSSSVDDEPFRLFSGLNDVFIAGGVALLSVGLFYFSLLNGVGSLSRGGAGATLLWLSGGTAVLWTLAEYLTGKKRMTAPSIILIIALCVFAFTLGTTVMFLVLSKYSGANANPSKFHILLPALAALIMSTVHYRRFKLPFSLALIAISLVGILVTMYALVVGSWGGNIDQTFGPQGQLLKLVRSLPWVFFALGIATFVVAMMYDTSDPERTTRAHSCGFWLHFVAAPMIVHPLAQNLIGSTSVQNTSGFWSAIALLAVLSLVSLVIDRRALLITGFAYLGGAIIYAVTQFAETRTTGVMLTLIIIGLFIILLGLAWHPVRRALLNTLPLGSLKQKLPQYKATT